MPLASAGRTKARSAASARSGAGRAGVRRYRIMRTIDDPHYVLIDLEFDTTEEAESLLASMRKVWERVAGVVVTNPQAKVVETMEVEEY